MRTLIITISVLAIAAMVYGERDPTILHKFYENYKKCNEELGGSPDEPHIDTIYCALKKRTDLINENDEFNKEVALQDFNDYISDASKSDQAKAIFTKCYDEAVASGATGKEQTTNIISCGISIMGLMDKEK